MAPQITRAIVMETARAPGSFASPVAAGCADRACSGPETNRNAQSASAEQAAADAITAGQPNDCAI